MTWADNSNVYNNITEETKGSTNSNRHVGYNPKTTVI